MLTLYQCFRRFLKKKRTKNKVSALYYKNFLKIKCPQLGGIIIQLRIVTPKKPNSARRPTGKTILTNGRSIISYIPGIGHNLRKHSEALVRGGGARDLPGVNYTFVRGVYGLSGVLGKIRRRSIYGIKKPDFLKKKLRRKFRKLFQ